MQVLGLHPNADLTFGFKEVSQLLDTILETQPKQVGAATGGKTREETVLAKCQELQQTMPVDYIEDDYEDRLAALGGFEVPRLGHVGSRCCVSGPMHPARGWT